MIADLAWKEFTPRDLLVAEWIVDWNDEEDMDHAQTSISGGSPGVAGRDQARPSQG
jgi:hypothetical protein